LHHYVPLSVAEYEMRRRSTLKFRLFSECRRPAEINGVSR